MPKSARRVTPPVRSPRLSLTIGGALLAAAVALPVLGWQDNTGEKPPAPAPGETGDKPAPAETGDEADEKEGAEKPELKTLEDVMKTINKSSKAGHKAFLTKQYPAATESVKKMVALLPKVKEMIPADVAGDAAQKKQFLAFHERMDKSLKASLERLEKKQWRDADLEYKKSLNVCSQCHKQFRVDED